MAARQQSKEQERSNTKKSVLDALRSLKAKKQEQPAQEQNYDMIDGCVNNVPKKPRRIGGRWSVLDRLHIKQAERKQKNQTQQQQQEERSRKN